MSIPTSGPIGMSTIASEFGGSTPHAMSEYRPGSGLVPSGTSGSSGSIPTTGPITIAQFRGSTNNPVVLNNHNIVDNGAFGAGATAQFRLLNNGVADNGSSAFGGEWLPSGTPSQYSVYAQRTGGSPVTSGTMDTWLNLGTSRAWFDSVSPSGSMSTTLLLTIRRDSTGAHLRAATIYLEANGGGDAPPCVVEDSWLENDVRASEVKVGELEFSTFDPELGLQKMQPVSVQAQREAECYALVTETGAMLRCSESTPFNLRDATKDMQEGKWRTAPDMLGQEVMVSTNGLIRWEKVVSVSAIGPRNVVPISFGGRSFPAGDDKNNLIYSHNSSKIII